MPGEVTFWSCFSRAATDCAGVPRIADRNDIASAPCPSIIRVHPWLKIRLDGLNPHNFSPDGARGKKLYGVPGESAGHENPPEACSSFA
jgi:hypothetical protein